MPFVNTILVNDYLDDRENFERDLFSENNGYKLEKSLDGESTIYDQDGRKLSVHKDNVLSVNLGKS